MHVLIVSKLSELVSGHNNAGPEMLLVPAVTSLNLDGLVGVLVNIS